jgi:membrane-bound ClpP family serine protease
MSITSVYYAFDYIFSIGVFGFLFTILSIIILAFANICATSTLKEYATYMLYGSLLIFLIFGSFWFFNKLKEWNSNPPVG